MYIINKDVILVNYIYIFVVFFMNYEINIILMLKIKLFKYLNFIY